MLSCTLSIVLHSVYLCLTIRHKQIGPTLGVSGGLCAVRQHLWINNKMAMCDILCDTLKFSKYDTHAHNKYFLQHFYCIHWECRPHFWDGVSLYHSCLKSNSVFTLSGTGTATGTGTGARTMGNNRSGPLSNVRCNAKALAQFYTAHLFPVPLPVLVAASVHRP